VCGIAGAGADADWDAVPSGYIFQRV